MNALLLLALVAFCAGAVVSIIQRSWLFLLLFAGLAAMVLDATGLVS